jgi:hypothetical protein
MRAFLEILFDWIFGCHHRHLSRVFTIDRRTFQVCLACGAELQYSWRTMSLIKTKTPQTLGSFAVAFTEAMNNLLDQSTGI